jgi:hypothetical protein
MIRMATLDHPHQQACYPLVMCYCSHGWKLVRFQRFKVVPCAFCFCVFNMRNIILFFGTLLAIGFVGYVSEFTAMYIWDQCFMFGGRASDWRKVLPVVCVTLLKVFVNLSLAQLFPPML